VASKIEQIDYINKTIPIIIESFKELSIMYLPAPEYEFSFSLEQDAILFIKSSFTNDDFIERVTKYYKTTDDILLSKIFTYTEILKSKVEKLLTEKANKISELKFKLL